MAKAKKKLLPKDFEALLEKGDIGELKAVFDNCEVDARGGVFKQTALAFNECPDEMARWLVAQGADLSAGNSYGETLSIPDQDIGRDASKSCWSSART
jgi:hypothetical protein